MIKKLNHQVVKQALIQITGHQHCLPPTTAHTRRAGIEPVNVETES
jgi:hypothetical protein